MRTCLYREVNREYEQYLVNLITSFLDTPSSVGNELLQLQIFINKRRHIGQMYLNITLFTENQALLRRKYFNSSYLNYRSKIYGF